jgi:protein tyrosine kinase modulator
MVAALANAYAQAYIDTIVEMKVEPAKQYARWFEDQTKSLRDNLEEAQGRLSKYQQDHGIVEKDERYDSESAKLRELSSQLTVVQAQTNDSRSKQKTGSDNLPEISQNTVIANLKSDVARKEATLQEAAINLGVNHPQYQRLQSELASLKARLDTETQYATRSFATASSVGQNKEAELIAAIEAQKRKLLRLRNQRDEIEVLQRDVAAATQALDSVNNRLNQTNLESQATRANAALLTPAVVPLEPSSPKPLRVMLLLAAALGAVIGVGVAFILETLDRRIRSAVDLAEMLQIPVLGVIRRIEPRRKALPGVVRPRLR